MSSEIVRRPNEEQDIRISHQIREAYWEQIGGRLVEYRRPVDYGELAGDSQVIGVYSSGVTKRSKDYNEEITILLHSLKGSGFNHYGVDALNHTFYLRMAQQLLEDYRAGETSAASDLRVTV